MSRSRSNALLLTVAAMCVACGRDRESGSQRGADISGSAAAERPDSLAFAAPGGVEVWYTMARDVEMPDGRRCEHRALEIRRGSTRVKVPLLYTASPPELADDSTMRARLWTGCDPGDLYLVNLTSGQPIREGVAAARQGRKEPTPRR